VALLLGTASLAQAQGGAAPAAPKAEAGATEKKPATKAGSVAEMNKASYSIGLQFGNQMKRAHLDNKNVSLAQIQKGMHDALGGKEFGHDDMTAIQTYITGIQEKVADENHAKAATFLAANAKKPGVQTTASGLQYKVLSPGSGASPQKTDTVLVNYTGRLLDGTEFDGTDKHGGQPASFPVGGVIQGFTEALLLMKPGAKFQVFIPPALAYDTKVPPGAPIPPGAALIFDIELVKIQPPAPPPASPVPGKPATPATPH
jgi:FKBP-type peptidyl-prolyl cis-trans isomerase